MNQPLNFHVLKVKHIGATNYNSAYVKIISERFQQSIKTPYTNDPGIIDPARDTALLWLKNNGFNVTGKGEGKDCYYIITDTFEPLKK